MVDERRLHDHGAIGGVDIEPRGRMQGTELSQHAHERFWLHVVQFIALHARQFGRFLLGGFVRHIEVLDGLFDDRELIDRRIGKDAVFADVDGQEGLVAARRHFGRVSLLLHLLELLHQLLLLLRRERDLAAAGLRA